MRSCSLSASVLSLQTRRQGGFTYLGLIILVTIIGLVAASTLRVGAIAQRRQAEQELLDIGSEYIAALKSYAAVTPAGQSTLPDRLDDLLLDSRFLAKKRHLRRVYLDPITGKSEWGIVRGTLGAGSGILGIYSLAGGRPVKVDNFDTPFIDFKGKKSYAGWVFTAQPPEQPASAAAPEPMAPGTPPVLPPRKPLH